MSAPRVDGPLAARLLAGGRPAEALAALGGAKEGWHLLLRARAKLELGRARLAEADCTRAFDADPACGWALGFGDAPDAAAARLAAGQAAFGRSPAAYPLRAWLGKLAAMAGRVEEALSHFDAAVAAAPRRAYLYAWRGETRRRSGDARGAAADFEKALRLEPREAVARVGRSRLRLAAGDAAGALADADRAARDLRGYEEAPLAGAKACLGLRDARGLLRRLETAFKRANRYGWRSLGPDADAALPRLAADPACAPPPWRARLLAWTGESRLAAGDAAGALAALDEALRLAPGLSWARGFKGEALAALGRAREAEAELARAAGPRAALARGRLRLAAGRVKQAEADFSRALAADPTWLAGRLARARARAARGDAAGAAADAAAAWRLNPRAPELEILARELEASGLAGAAAAARRGPRRAPAEGPLDAACAAAREGRWDAAAAALSGGRAGLDLGAVLRNDPRNDLMYSELPAAKAPSAAERARWAALARRDGRAELWALLGAAETAAGRLERALDALGRALRADPSLDEALLLRAAARLLYGSFTRRARTSRWLLGAVEDLDRLLARRPDDARARRLRGEARKDLQDYAGAQEDLEAAIRLAPADGWAYAELAELHCDAGRFERAGALLAELETRHAGEGWFQALKGRALAASGKVAEALTALERAVALAPGSAPVVAWRGEALRRVGRVKEALADFDRSIALDPRFAYAYEWRGRLLLALGRHADALADLRTVVRQDPRHFSGPVMRGEARFKLGDYRRAAEDFDRVYPLDPRTTWTPRAGEGRPPGPREAEYWSDHDAAVAARPRDPWPLALRGRAYALAGRLPEALADLRASLALRPLPYARAGLGLALLHAGDPAGALAALAGVRGRWPAAWRGRAELALRRPHRALREFGRALAHEDSLVAQVHEWKAEALEALGRFPEAARERARSGRWRGLARGEEGRRAPAAAPDPGREAAELAGRGRWRDALARLSPEAAALAPAALADFYTFVGEDDLLSRDPRRGLMSPALTERALAAVDRLPAGGRREGLAAFVLLCAGRVREAAGLAEAACRLDPGDARLAALCGAAYWLLGDRERTKRFVPLAWRHAERAVAAGERGRDALLLRAQVRFEFDDHDGALADLDAVLALDPEDDDTRVGKVDKLLDMDRFDDALREMAVLLRRHPRAWWAYAQRGRIHALAGRCERALPDFERARRLNPRSGALDAWKAEALRKLGRLREARALLERAKRREPGYSLAWEHSGRLRLIEGDAAKALSDLDRACRLDAVRTLSFAWRGEAAFKLGRYERAWADFERAAPLEPRATWNAPASGGRAAGPAAREARFWSDLDAAAASGKGGVWPRLLRGRFRVVFGREREALEDLTAACGPDAPAGARAAALAWRGRAALRLGAPARALADLDASLSLEPSAARAGAWRAEALLGLGREQDALRQLDAALQEPDRALVPALLLRAGLHERAGRAEPARRDYEAVYALDGGCAEARAALARLDAAPALSGARPA